MALAGHTLLDSDVEVLLSRLAVCILCSVLYFVLVFVSRWFLGLNLSPYLCNHHVNKSLFRSENISSS